MSRFLLDTHAVLWSFQDSPRLSLRAREAIMKPDNHIHVSPVSAYELGYKAQLGKLPQLMAPFSELVARSNFATLPLTVVHAEAAAALISDHRDPWDRLLAGQAMVENLTLITCDPAVQDLGARWIW
jgi:PIN domain nuclease of toxin-antitoxin system